MKVVTVASNNFVGFQMEIDDNGITLHQIYYITSTNVKYGMSDCLSSEAPFADAAYLDTKGKMINHLKHKNLSGHSQDDITDKP